MDIGEEKPPIYVEPPMRRSVHNVIGVGTWVEGSRQDGRWYRLDPRDLRSWFLHPVLTLKELFVA